MKRQSEPTTLMTLLYSMTPMAHQGGAAVFEEGELESVSWECTSIFTL